MEFCTLRKTYKEVKSDEECKKMWMSLFDISVMSSCNGKDPDLFCASALLKTAFNSFIKLKRRLIETENLIERQRLALEAYKQDTTVVKSKSPSVTSAVCFRCGYTNENSKWLPGERSSNVQQTIETTDNTSTNDSRIYSRSSKGENSYSTKENVVSRKQDSQNRVENLLLEKDSEVSLGGPVNLEDGDVSDVDNTCISPISKSKSSLCNLMEGADDTHSKISVQCVTPTKRKCQAESQDISPILKHFKKPRLSPTMSFDASQCEKKPLKSPPLFPLENLLSLKKNVTKGVGNDGLFTAGKKISLNSLRLKKMQTGPAPQVSVKNPKDGSPEAHKSSENEELEIILPSPDSPKSMSHFSNKGISSLDGANEENTEKRNQKAQNSMNQMPADNEVTFFLPMEEEGSEESEDQGVVEGNDGLTDQEEDCKQERVGNVQFLDSFDQVPSKSDSPSYRYQRAAVRSKKERRKLFGWECKDCQKYYEAAGLSPGEKREHLNKCSRHRDKFSPEDRVPEGFWNPVFPETPR